MHERTVITYCCLDEQSFANKSPCSNVPVNVVVSLEFLKAPND
jgi:hypothetical protein